MDIKESQDFHDKYIVVAKLLAECLRINNVSFPVGAMAIHNLFAVTFHNHGNSYKEFCKFLDQIKKTYKFVFEDDNG